MNQHEIVLTEAVTMLASYIKKQDAEIELLKAQIKDNQEIQEKLIELNTAISETLAALAGK